KEQVSDEEAKELEAKIAKGQMTMDDFLKQMKSLRRMGPLKQIMGLLPGIGSALKDVNIDDKQLDHVEGMVSSMTKEERKTPGVLNHGRRNRIAKGSGQKPEQVAALVKQFTMISEMSRRMATMSAGDKMKAMQAMQSGAGMGGMMAGMGMPRMKGSTAMASPKSKFKKRR
ncbi:MAG TPA: signal recognition particle protein, partial [Phycisphaerales bacterium]|nr:signal recognition particle protein [Phycisphaerales bacterium]